MTRANRNKRDERGSYVEPSKVEAEDGQVFVDGPDGVAVVLTPEAALETGNRLIDQGLTANGQEVASGRAKSNKPTLPQR